MASATCARQQRGSTDGLDQYRPLAAGLPDRLLRLHVHDRVQRGESDVIDTAAVLKVIATLLGFWGSGYVVGKSVAWVRKIASVA